MSALISGIRFPRIREEYNLNARDGAAAFDEIWSGEERYRLSDYLTRLLLGAEPEDETPAPPSEAFRLTIPPGYLSYMDVGTGFCQTQSTDKNSNWITRLDVLRNGSRGLMNMHSNMGSTGSTVPVEFDWKDLGKLRAGIGSLSSGRGNYSLCGRLVANFCSTYREAKSDFGNDFD